MFSARYVCVHLQGAALVAVRSLEKSCCKYNKLLIFLKHYFRMC